MTIIRAPLTRSIRPGNNSSYLQNLLKYSAGSVILILPFTACKSTHSRHMQTSEVMSEANASGIGSIGEFSNGQYIIRSLQSGRCLDVPEGAAKNGLQLQIWDCHDSPVQKFTILKNNENNFSFYNVSSGMAIDVRDTSRVNGGTIQEWDKNYAPQQQFNIEDKGNGRFAITSVLSGLSLDVKDGSTANGATIQQWGYGGGGNQQWSLIKVVDRPIPNTTLVSGYPEGRGAAVPWTEYQAEDGQTNAKVIGPNRNRYDINHIEAEAIGRRAVRLENNGDFVAFKSKQAGNTVVVRFSIPDAPAGGGMDATIGVYINGRRVKSLELTSRYSWVYGGEELTTPNAPGGAPHTFFDEARAFVDNYPAGAEIKIQKDGEDRAAFYVIDLIDLEQVAAPLQKPDNLISITDYGAQPNDNIDDADAIQKAIDELGATGKAGIWIPAGTFLVNNLKNGNASISLKGATVKGAGMWYSNLKGAKAGFACWGEGVCQFADFSILGTADRRDDNVANNGFNGGLGKGSSVNNVWVEHVKVGMWVGTDKDPFGTDGLVVRNSRFRNIYADGINFANGTRNSLVENNHFRNTGDDALAMWSYKLAGDQPDHDNTFRHNTVQMPWRANCFAIYGGTSNHVEDSVCEDVLTYPGIMISNNFSAYPFQGTTTFKNISVYRGGGSMFNQDWGAVSISTPQGGVSNIALENIDIVDSTFSGLQFDGLSGDITNVSLRNVKIVTVGTTGILATSGARGNVSFQDVLVTGPRQSGKQSQGTADSFFNRLSGNDGW